MAALYVFLGGGLGSLCRYAINNWMASHSLKLPVATLSSNILAGLILGLIVALAAKHSNEQQLLLFGAVGFCGGFSTFSTFSLENVQLWQSGHYSTLLMNILLSVLLCFGGVLLGMKLGQLFN